MSVKLRLVGVAATQNRSQYTDTVTSRIKSESNNLHRTPALNDTCKEGLFWIVRDIRTKAVDDLAIFAVAAEDYIRAGHVLLQRAQDPRQRGMEKLTSKLAEVCILVILLLGCVPWQ